MSFFNPNPAGGTGGGAVSSVNGQVGAVVLGAADVGAYTTAQVDALIAGLQAQIDQRVKLLGASAVTATLTGTLVETTLAQIVIPANTLGPNGVIDLEWCFGRDTTFAASMIWNVKFNGIAGNTLQQVTLTSGQRMSRAHLMLGAANNTAIQRSTGVSPDTSGYGVATTVAVAFTADMTQVQTLNITARLTDITDTALLFNYCATLAYQA